MYYLCLEDIVKKDILSKYALIGQLICTQFSEIYELKESKLIEMEPNNSDISKDIKLFDKISHSLVNDLIDEHISDNELEYRLNSALNITREYLEHMNNCLKLAKKNSINQNDEANIKQINFENLMNFINSLKGTEERILNVLGE